MAEEIGFARSKGEISNRLGDLSLQTRNVLRDWAELADSLEDLGTAELAAMYGDPGAQLINRACIDMRLLNRIFYGKTTLTEARDFTFNLRKLWGLR